MQEVQRCEFNPWAGKIPWGRKWQRTSVFLPEKFHGQRSLAGYSPWGHIKSGTTECTHTHPFTHIHTYTKGSRRKRSPVIRTGEQ